MKSFMNFVLLIIGALKGDMWVRTGRAMLVLGATSSAIPTLSAKYKNITFSLSNESSLSMEILGGLLIVFGIILIFWRFWSLQAKPPYLVYVRGLSNMEVSDPIKALPKSDWHAKSLNYEIQSYDRDKLIEDYKYMKWAFEHRIEHQNASKVYIASLASFPALFLVGTLFRNAHIETVLLDYNRHKTKWYQLKELSDTEDYVHHILAEDETVGYEAKLNQILENSPTEVGVALAYTFEIPNEQIPEKLREYTLFLKSSLGYGHDKLSDKESQKRLLNELSLLFNQIYKSKGVEKIHLFVSAQASMTIALGLNYMDNAHGVIVLHNYDNQIKSYNWSIIFSKGTISVNS
jgi:hypothetical protein